MLLTVAEAVIGRQYLTSKGLVPVVVRGPAPKLKATDNPMWTLVYQDTGKTIDVPGSYDLTTPDVDSPLLGTAPRVDAFALNTVAWGRERVPRLSDADLELLAEIDTRPGIRTAISAEVLRRGEARAKVPAEPMPAAEILAIAEASRAEVAPERATEIRAHLDELAAADDFEAPVFGDLPAAGDPLTPVDDGVASAFPDDATEVAAIRAEVDRTFDAGFADRLRAGEAKDLDATFPETHPEHPVVVLDAALDGPNPCTTCGHPERAHCAEGFGRPPGSCLAGLDSDPCRCLAFVGATPTEVPTVGEVQPERTLDGLEDVFGDRPAEPTPRTEHHSARDIAIRELGADFVDVARTIDTGEITLTVRNPNDPNAGRSFEAPTLDAAITAAREWLAAMRAPVEPRRKRRVSPPPVSPPSPDVEALTRRIAELETGAKDYCGLMEDFDKSRAINLELEAKLDAVTAERDQLRHDLDQLRDDAGKSRAALLDAVGLSVGHGWADIMSRVTAEHAQLTVATAEIAHLRSLKIEGGATPASFPTNLSEAGADRARRVQTALRALADTVPWTTAAAEASAALRELGVSMPEQSRAR